MNSTTLRHRPTDPVAMTWEPFALVCGGWLAGTAYSPAAALTLAGGATGHGWTWPSNPFGVASDMLTSGPAVAIAIATTTDTPGPPTALVLVLVAVFQVLLLLVLALAVRRWWGHLDRSRPNGVRRRGHHPTGPRGPATDGGAPRDPPGPVPARDPVDATPQQPPAPLVTGLPEVDDHATDVATAATGLVDQHPGRAGPTLRPAAGGVAPGPGRGAPRGR